jgi:pSer/pThr/pTyr-binding forkhead associated (FHA) protein
MILRRLIIFLIVVFLGIGLGIFIIDQVGREAGLSRTLIDLLMVIFIGISITASLMLGKNIPSEGIGMDIDLPSTGSKKTGKSYAWLIPQAQKTQAGFPITRKFMIVGRGVEADITINEPTVSKKHAQLTSFDSGFLLKDLDSSNGTFINNQRIQEAYLGDGDLVTFGEAKFIFSFPKETSVIHEEESELSPADLDLSINLEDFESGVRTNTGTKSRKGSRLRDLTKNTRKFFDRKIQKQRIEKTFAADSDFTESGDADKENGRTGTREKPQTGKNQKNEE